MAVIDKKTFNVSKVFQCDKCGKTKPFSLSYELSSHLRGEASWFLHPDGFDKALCNSCLISIVDAWYFQKEVTNFKLSNEDTSNTKKKKYKATA